MNQTTQEAAARLPERNSPQAAESNQEMINKLVRAFYAKARVDPLLGPVFNTRIQDWEPHLRTIVDFWSSLTLMSAAYGGQPMSKHLDLKVDARHFDRWLALWEATARELCPEAAAERFVALARRVGASLELGIAGRRGILLLGDERLSPPNE